MEYHSIANIFPMMQSGELQKLANDIQSTGLRNKIILYEGKVLDGRNRFEACQLAGVEAEYDEYDEDEPLAYVISQNLHRRHLSESQRAVVASRLANMSAGRKWDSNSANLPNNISQPEAAEMLNVSERMIRSVKEIERDAPELIEEIESGNLTVHKAVKKKKAEERGLKRAEMITTMPVGKYAVILADPPWQYSNSGFDQSAESQYTTMPTDDICNMFDIVDAFSTPETVMFMWATNPLLKDALKVMDAWGYEYKTNMAWIKDKAPGMGWFTKSKHELLLIGTRGNTPHPKERPDSYFEAIRTVHSRKPQVVYEIIEAMYDGAKLEMFCRVPREGWVAHGNEL